MEIKSAQHIIEYLNRTGKTVPSLMIDFESDNSGLSRQDVIDKMMQNLDVMKRSVEDGLRSNIKSVSGLTGGDALRLYSRLALPNSICDGTLILSAARAMAVAEVNASMGRIVAAPTAGSCGVIPGVLLTVGQKLGLSDRDLIDGLFTASCIGMIIAYKATLSGAEGGCQAEIGSAAAMASGAVITLAGGSVENVFDAAAMAINNMMGLICDPVAGLVEEPCIKRNAAGAANALICAEMALAGIKPLIPFDEVVSAMKSVGKRMPCELKETALGGIAATATAKRITEQVKTGMFLQR